MDIWAESGHDGTCKKVVYALRFKYMNTTGIPIPVNMKFIDSKGGVLKEDVLNFPETPDKWKMMNSNSQ